MRKENREIIFINNFLIFDKGIVFLNLLEETENVFIIKFYYSGLEERKKNFSLGTKLKNKTSSRNNKSVELTKE